MEEGNVICESDIASIPIVPPAEDTHTDIELVAGSAGRIFL